MDYKNILPKQYEIIKSLLELTDDRSEGFGVMSNGYFCFESYLDSLPQDKQDDVARKLIEITGDMAKSFIEIYAKQIEKKSKALSDKLSAPILREEKQMIFSASEAQKICAIKSKDTMNKYLNNGTIKGKKVEGSNRWQILRKDLAEYLGHNDF